MQTLLKSGRCDDRGVTRMILSKHHPRLPISGSLGAPVEWSPSERDWIALEKAYGKAFSDALKTTIIGAVNKYLEWYPTGPSAPLRRPFLEKLEEARRLARELQRVVGSMGEASCLLAPHWKRYFPVEEWEPKPAGASLEEILAMPMRKGRNHRDIDEMIWTIGSALDDTIREVTSPDAAQYLETDLWDSMIDRLIVAFRSAGLKVSASNDPEGMSAFVRFIEALQNKLDERYRLYMSNADPACAKSTLAKAVSARISRSKPALKKRKSHAASKV
jgi:hypothetical protein